MTSKISDENGLISQDQSEDNKKTNEQSSTIIKWEAPIGNWIKINTSCAFSDEQGIASICFAVRDSNAWLLDGWNCRLNVESPLQAEIKVMESAISYAIENELDEVIFESDNEILIDSIIKEKTPPEWGCDTLLENIQALRNNIRNHKFLWLPKEANLVADWMAKVSLNEPRHVDWVLGPPSFVQDLIMKDYLEIAQRLRR
ncbi:uncharacterized protein LOC129301093 [Prosopis cineraria]|uniref:uncharacterized protein LOC129301093 n=1 Tax=Prosopis cineraria TaxID=364024 RepID=UPI00240F378C|nr:uncharacterized protein LOC129301093 [Prosopis cineraria]